MSFLGIMFIPSFMTIGQLVHKLKGDTQIDRHTHRQHGDLITLFSFPYGNKSRLQLLTCSSYNFCVTLNEENRLKVSVERN